MSDASGCARSAEGGGGAEGTGAEGFGAGEVGGESRAARSASANSAFSKQTPLHCTPRWSSSSLSSESRIVSTSFLSLTAMRAEGRVHAVDVTGAHARPTPHACAGVTRSVAAAARAASGAIASD
eukprot:scaffold6300_cov23-Tisochrysis_lutea.AAC.1